MTWIFLLVWKDVKIYPKRPILDVPTLVWIRVWCYTSNKPLPGSIVTHLMTLLHTIRSQWVNRMRGGAQACRHAWCQNDQPHTAAILALLVEVSDLGPEPHLSRIFVIFVYLVYYLLSWTMIQHLTGIFLIWNGLKIFSKRPILDVPTLVWVRVWY